MLRLLFTSVAIAPMIILPWMTSKAKSLPDMSAGASFAEQVMDPNLRALADCRPGELPVFFHDTLVTTHTAEYIEDAVKLTRNCASATVTIVPVLPEFADANDIGQSVMRTAELAEFFGTAANISGLKADIDIAENAIEEDISTLYMNGRAAILLIEPKKG